MAGEWIPYDVCLPTKPEVIELLEETGAPADAVIGRLLQFWGWAALHAEGGTARMTLDRLGRMFGGDADFWLAVENVGWLAVDSAGGTVSIPGWEDRFSKTAKARALQLKRAANSRECGPTALKRTHPCATAHAPLRSGALERGEEREDREHREEREETGPEPSASSSVENTPEEDQAAWEALRAAWRRGPGKPWPSLSPPEKLEDRLREPGWLAMALRAIERLQGCKYFQSPVGLGQLVSNGFVNKIVAGDFDSINRPKILPGDRPPAVGWDGDDAARFAATKAHTLRMLALRESGG